jgi:AraC-like DNA-binding protein
MTELVHVSRIAGLTGFELLEVQRSERTWRLVNERYCISVMLSGRTTYRYRGKSYEKTRGDITLHEPGEAYASSAQRGKGRAITFFLRPELVAIMVDSARPPHFRPGPSNDVRLVAAFTKVAAAVRTGHAPIQAQLCLIDALDAAMTSRRERSNERLLPRDWEHPAVRKAKKRLHEAALAGIPLSDLASEARVHPLHLVRLFRKEVGMPPHAYSVALRVARARELLNKGRTATEVAAMLGYFDQSHLSRHFKAALSMTPGRYRDHSLAA